MKHRCQCRDVEFASRLKEQLIAQAGKIGVGIRFGKNKDFADPLDSTIEKGGFLLK